MTELLPGVVSSGTARAAALGRPTAGKTGTTIVEQGRLVHRLLERPHHRRLDGPRRQSRVARPFRRPGAGARLPRFDDPRRRQPAGRAVPDRRPGARLATAGPTMQLLEVAPPDDEPSEPSFVDQDGNPIEQTQPDDESIRRWTTTAARPEEAVRRGISGRGLLAGLTGGRPCAARRHDAAARRAPGADRHRAAARHEGVEFRPVIEVDEMRHLVRDGRAADEIGGEDQPPAVADRRRCSSSSPSARPDRRRRPAPAVTPAFAGEFARLGAQQRPTPRPSASAAAAAQALGRTADQQAPVFEA